MKEGVVFVSKYPIKDVGIYTASDDPSDYTIEMHNELTYSNVFPSKVSYY